MIGKIISHYKILTRTGSGGMGEVYKAQDTKLDRFVALKFLPSYFSEDAAKKKRFIQEAKAASALDHPNICTIYEINETEDGQMYIAMGYYEGETLKLSIDNWQLTIDNSIDIAIQIAEGLNRAHQKGIVHRDIKPANIMVTEEGMVKILDFGVAKMADIKLTKTDSTLGTIAYMSPEQVRSEEVDQRADIWSLGVILYEMLSGQLPFRGIQEHAVMYAILNRKPEPLEQFCPEVPSSLIHIVNHALEKEAEVRYQTMQEMLGDLQPLKDSPHSSFTSSPETSKGAVRKIRPRVKLKSKKLPLKQAGMFTFLTALALLLLYLFFSDKIMDRAKSPPVSSTHRQLTFTGNVFMQYSSMSWDVSALSPDGQFIAYALQKNRKLSVMVQDISGGQPIEIISGIMNLSTIRWSSDGLNLMFFAWLSDTTYAAYIFPRLGGKPRKIESFLPINCWSPDGSQIAGTAQNKHFITFVNRTTGDSTRSIQLSGFHFLNDLDWSPDGERLLLLASNENSTQHTIWTVKIDGSGQEKVVEQNERLCSPRWAADGWAIYYLQSSGSLQNLMKIKVSATDGKAEGQPRVLQTGLQAYGFSVSEDNRKLAYTKHLSYSNLWRVSREGNSEASLSTQKLTGGTSLFEYPQFSPDGKRIAFSHRGNIHVMPVEGGDMEQLTFLDSECYSPNWSLNGKEIAFVSDNKVWRVPSASGIPRVFENTEANGQLAWAPGRDILYLRLGLRNFHLLNPQTGEERPLITNDSLGWILGARYSPDDKSVAINWNRKDDSKDGVWLISLEDGPQTFLYPGLYSGPVAWSADGKWVYILNYQPSSIKSMRSQMFKVSTSGSEQQAFVTLPFGNIPWWEITMTPDGQQIICSVEETLTDVWLIENFDPEVE